MHVQFKTIYLQPYSCILIRKLNIMSDLITKEIFFKHPIDTVWNAISRAEELSTWFIKANFKAEKGYHYTFNSQEEDCSEISGTVLQADPYTLVYTWIVKDNPAETTVKWVLEEMDGGTKLYLEHSGISNYTKETAITMFNSFSGGWDNCIKGLIHYLKQPINAG